MMASVYAIQAGDDGPIKIGVSTDVEARLFSLQCANPFDLKLIDSIEAVPGLEKRLHHHCRHHRIRGEWFQPVREIAEAFETARQGGIDALEKPTPRPAINREPKERVPATPLGSRATVVTEAEKELVDWLFDVLGGTSVIAHFNGWPVSTVHSWTKTRVIPDWRRPGFVRAAISFDVELTDDAYLYLDKSGDVRRSIAMQADLFETKTHEAPLIQSDDYPDSPGHRGVDTSVEAAESMKAVAPTLQRQVLALIIAAGEHGMTTNEIAAAMKIDRGSIQPRTSELRNKRQIMDNGARRKNENGKNAIVWVAQKDE